MRGSDQRISDCQTMRRGGAEEEEEEEWILELRRRMDL